MDKVVVITGASSGIGLQLGNFLTKKGYIVFGLSRSTSENSKFETISTDVTNLTACVNSIQKIISQTGKIDFLINNAGKGMVGAIEDANDEEILSLFQLNLLGAIHTIQAILPFMRNENEGKIINISSIGSMMGLPFRGYYSASKAALDQCTEALRYEIRDFGVQACVVHLGDIQTEIANHRIETKVSEPYKENFKKVLEGMNVHVNSGSSPEKVAEYIEKLMLKKSLKAHYYFGKPLQIFSLTLKKVLPQNVFESLMRKYSGL